MWSRCMMMLFAYYCAAIASAAPACVPNPVARCPRIFRPVCKEGLHYANGCLAEAACVFDATAEECGEMEESSMHGVPVSDEAAITVGAANTLPARVSSGPEITVQRPGFGAATTLPARVGGPPDAAEAEAVNCCGGGGACGYEHCPALGAGTEGCVHRWEMPDGMDFELDCAVALTESAARTGGVDPKAGMIEHLHAKCEDCVGEGFAWQADACQKVATPWHGGQWQYCGLQDIACITTARGCEYYYKVDGMYGEEHGLDLEAEAAASAGGPRTRLPAVALACAALALAAFGGALVQRTRARRRYTEFMAEMTGDVRFVPHVAMLQEPPLV
uniref:Kazal-like domain-containing protein n=1 Tax=Emiliania huxleyi TaxID=2903 RepID=A0A7S3T8B6_EMIHU